MAVNRFMKPAKADYFQTYVSQYVPQPFELMQRAVDNKQKKKDAMMKSLEGIDAYADQMKAYTQTDQAHLAEITQSIHDEVDNIMSSGDLTTQENQIRKLGRAIGQEYQGGELGKLVRGYDVLEKYNKKKASAEWSTKRSQEDRDFAEAKHQWNLEHGGGDTGLLDPTQTGAYTEQQEKVFRTSAMKDLRDRFLGMEYVIGEDGKGHLTGDNLTEEEQKVLGKYKALSSRYINNGAMIAIGKGAKGMKWERANASLLNEYLNNSEMVHETKITLTNERIRQARAAGEDVNPEEVFNEIPVEAVEAVLTEKAAYDAADVAGYEGDFTVQRTPQFSANEKTLTDSTVTVTGDSTQIVKTPAIGDTWGTLGTSLTSALTHTGVYSGSKAREMVGNFRRGEYKDQNGNYQPIIGTLTGKNYQGASEAEITGGVLQGDIDIPSEVTGKDRGAVMNAVNTAHKNLVKAEKLRKEAEYQVLNNGEATSEEVQLYKNYDATIGNAFREHPEFIPVFQDVADNQLFKHPEQKLISHKFGVTQEDVDKQQNSIPRSLLNIFVGEPMYKTVASLSAQKLAKEQGISVEEAAEQVKEYGDQATAEYLAIIEQSKEDGVNLYGKARAVENVNKKIKKHIEDRNEKVVKTETASTPHIRLMANGKPLSTTDPRYIKVINDATKKANEALKAGEFNDDMGTDQMGNKANLTDVRNRIARDLDAEEVEYTESISYERNPIAGEYGKIITVTGTAANGESIVRTLRLPESSTTFKTMGGLKIENQTIEADAKRFLSNLRDGYGNASNDLALEFGWFPQNEAAGLEVNFPTGNAQGDAVRGNVSLDVVSKDGQHSVTSLSEKQITDFTSALILIDRKINNGEISIQEAQDRAIKAYDQLSLQ